MTSSGRSRSAAADRRALTGTTLLGVGCAAVIVVALGKSGLLRADMLRDAWQSQRGLLWQMVALQAGAALLSVLRYHAVLRAAGARVKLSDAAAATLVGTGISLWLPASTGVSEVLRIGLMCGVETPQRQGRLAQISVASLLDRAIGFVTVFLFGAVAASWLALRGGSGPGTAPALAWTAAAFAGVAMSLALLMGVLIRTPSPQAGTALGPGRDPFAVWRLPRRLLEAAALLRRQAVHGRDLVVPALQTALVFLALIRILQLSILAVGGQVSFAVVAVALPILTVAGLLPISIGGLGGQQLASVALLRLLGCDPAAVASAGILSAGVVLSLHTLLAALFAGISLNQLRRLVRTARTKEKDY